MWRNPKRSLGSPTAADWNASGMWLYPIIFAAYSPKQCDSVAVMKKNESWRRNTACCLGFAVLASMAGCTRMGAQRSTGGEVYRNAQFGIEMTIPSGMHQVDVSTLGFTAKATTDDFPMMAAKEGDDPYGIVMIAQRLNVGRMPLVDASDFMRRVEKGRDPNAILGRGETTNASGLVMDHLDWKEPNGQFGSAVITRVQDYLIVVRCNAKSESDIKAMVNAFTSMRRTANSK